MENYIGEQFVFLDGRQSVFRWNQFGRWMPHDSQLRPVDEILVPVGWCFYVRSKKMRYYLGGKRYSRMDATETVGTPPSAAQRVERFQTGHSVHGVSI